MTKFVIMRQTVIIETKIPVPANAESEWPVGPLDPELMAEIDKESSADAKRIVSAYGGPYEIVDMKAEARIVEV